MIVHARWGQVKWGLAGQQLAVAPKVGGGRFPVSIWASSGLSMQRHAHGSWFLKSVAAFHLVVGTFLVSRALPMLFHLTRKILVGTTVIPFHRWENQG